MTILMSKMLVYDMVDTNCQKYLNISEITLGLHTYKPGNLRSNLASVARPFYAVRLSIRNYKRL